MSTENKFLKKDPTSTGNLLSHEAVQQGWRHLHVLAKARKKLDRETIILCVNNPKSQQPERLLGVELEELMNAELSTAANEILKEMTDDLIAEMERNGISITQETLELLVPDVEI